MSLQSNDRYMIVHCKSEYPVEWSINQRVITKNPRMKIIKDGLYLCRAKTKTHYSRLSYFKVRLPKNGKPPRNLTTSTTSKVTTTTTTSTMTSTMTSTTTTTTTPQAIRLVRPKITGEKIIQVGHSLALECTTEYADDIKFSWFLNEEPIIDQENSLLSMGEVKESFIEKISKLKRGIAEIFLSKNIFIKTLKDVGWRKLRLPNIRWLWKCKLFWTVSSSCRIASRLCRFRYKSRKTHFLSRFRSNQFDMRRKGSRRTK